MNGSDDFDRRVEERLDKLEVAVAVLRSRVTIGFTILGMLTAVPKLGGPTLVEALQFAWPI